MKKTINCKACKGSGILVRVGRKWVINWSKDPWDYSGIGEGRQYRYFVCPKCKGHGFIIKSK